MVSANSVLALSLAASAAVAQSSVSAEQSAELQAIIADIQGNLQQYLALQTAANSDFKIPPEVISLYAQIATYTDESYTSLFTELDVSALTATVTNLPWYSSRLLPAIERVQESFSGNGTESATASASSNATVAESSAESSSTAIAAPSSISTSNVTAGNAAATAASHSGSASITHISSGASASASHNATASGNSTKTSKSSKEKNGAEFAGASSGLLFAGLAALLL